MGMGPDFASDGGFYSRSMLAERFMALVKRIKNEAAA